MGAIQEPSGPTIRRSNSTDVRASGGWQASLAPIARISWATSTKLSLSSAALSRSTQTHLAVAILTCWSSGR